VSRIAFKMKLFEGYADEYKRRHDAIWPELHTLLKQAGISEYSIFLDEKTHELFGVMDAIDENLVNALPQKMVMKKWWTYMKDIMETNPDNSPISTPLEEVFYMP
jgi:L-rhamnose mutarotase